MKSLFSLSPSESKRLIAKGAANLPSVKKAMKKGIVFVGRGTTNAYIVEELSGQEFEKGRYVAGAIIEGRLSQCDPDLILNERAFIDGEMVEITVFDAVEKMGGGDVFFKGGNILGADRVAGVHIGHPNGGTVGAALGRVYARGIDLVVPIGLEKYMPVNVRDITCSIGINTVDYATGMKIGLFPLIGQTITEIEALEILSGVKAIPYGSGGVNGGEGSTVLLAEGDSSAMEKAISLINSVIGEPPINVPHKPLSW